MAQNDKNEKREKNALGRVGGASPGVAGRRLSTRSKG